MQDAKRIKSIEQWNWLAREMTAVSKQRFQTLNKCVDWFELFAIFVVFIAVPQPVFNHSIVYLLW